MFTTAQAFWRRPDLQWNVLDLSPTDTDPGKTPALSNLHRTATAVGQVTVVTALARTIYPLAGNRLLYWEIVCLFPTEGSADGTYPGIMNTTTPLDGGTLLGEGVYFYRTGQCIVNGVNAFSLYSHDPGSAGYRSGDVLGFAWDGFYLWVAVNNRWTAPNDEFLTMSSDPISGLNPFCALPSGTLLAPFCGVSGNHDVSCTVNGNKHNVIYAPPTNGIGGTRDFKPWAGA